MKQNLSVAIGISILISVFFGAVGIGYSFYKNEIVESNPESSDIANKNSLAEQQERETNSLIVPVPRSQEGRVGIDSNSTGGIPIGTYSNPPRVIDSGDNFNSTSIDRPIDSFDSRIESNGLNREGLTNSFPDYNNTSSTNQSLDHSSNNSLIRPLDDDDFLETPTSEDNFTEPSYLNDSTSPF